VNCHTAAEFVQKKLTFESPPFLLPLKTSGQVIREVTEGLPSTDEGNAGQWLLQGIFPSSVAPRERLELEITLVHATR
jgi:hypothetical protein